MTGPSICFCLLVCARVCLALARASTGPCSSLRLPTDSGDGKYWPDLKPSPVPNNTLFVAPECTIQVLTPSRLCVRQEDTTHPCKPHSVNIRSDSLKLNKGIPRRSAPRRRQDVCMYAGKVACTQQGIDNSASMGIQGASLQACGKANKAAQSSKGILGRAHGSAVSGLGTQV